MRNRLLGKVVVVVLAMSFLTLLDGSFLGAASSLKVGMVTTESGIGDRSYNDSAYAGLTRAKEELGVSITILEPTSQADYQEMLRQMAKTQDLIIGVGWGFYDPIRVVASEFPKKKFVAIDTVVDLPNVASLMFKEHEGSFLAGALAAMVTKTNKVGFVGGMDAPLIQKFLQGYTQGVHYINPKVNVMSAFVGSFQDPAKAKELALLQFSQGADIVYQAAGQSGEGVIAAAKQVGKLAIGVDSDQDYIAPGFVLTSMMKRVDNALFDTIKRAVEGRWSAGEFTYGIKENGVGLTSFKYTRDKIPAGAIEKLEEIRAKIISGEIKVVDPTAK